MAVTLSSSFAATSISVRTAAIDMGSGKTKITVADVQRNPKPSAPWIVSKTVWKAEEALKFSDDLAVSKDGMLSATIQDKGIALLKKFKVIAAEQGATDFYCIATEVFRKALNGEAFIERINQEVGIPVRMISQEEEAMLGFTTGVAVGSLAPEKAIVVDHGSGSFQVSSLDQGTLVAFNGKLGTIPLAKALIEKIQKTPYTLGAAPQPLSEVDAIAFVQHVQTELATIPDWLSKKVSDTPVSVVGLAGPAGTFGLCAAVAGKITFTKQELWEGIQNKLLERPEAEIKAAFGKIYDVTLLPRVLFVYSLMDRLNLSSLTWAESNGCTEGMLITPSFWKAPIQSKL